MTGQEGPGKIRILDNCDDCGACCQSTPVPPFEPGEEAAYDVPPEALELIRERIRRDEHLDRLACVWFDSQSLRCRHYEIRPTACRKFEINSDLCRLARWDVGLD